MNKNKENRECYSILPLSQDAAGKAPINIQLLPYGLVSTDKGEFLVDEQGMEEIINSFSQQTNDVVVDYEHQTLKDVIAPAGGWIKKLENRGKDGLWAQVEWTPRAQDFIQNKEYRYISPVVLARRSDNRAVFLHSAALTNTPAIDGMQPIANKKTGQDPEGNVNMDFMKKLALKLGLPETATEAEVMQVLETLQTNGKLVANKDVLSLLELPETASLDQAKGKIIALKNPSGYVRVEDFNAMRDQLANRDRDELVTLALTSGKVAPAQKAWAEQYALKDPSGFKAFLEHAPAIVPVNQEFAGGADPKRQPVTDEVQMMINKQLGISEEDFKKYGDKA